MRTFLVLVTIVLALVTCHAAVADSCSKKKDAPIDPEAMKKLEALRWVVPDIGLAMRRIPAGTFTMGSVRPSTSTWCWCRC